MASTPLIVAIVAGSLLVLSVAGDLAFSQSVSLEGGLKGGTLALLATSDLDEPYARPNPLTDPIEANRTDTLTFRVRLENGYPWGSTHSFTLTTDGCYQGARSLAVVDVTAPARGVGSGSVDVGVGRLLDAAGQTGVPKPIGGDSTYVQIVLCRNEMDGISASLPIREVAK